MYPFFDLSAAPSSYPSSTPDVILAHVPLAEVPQAAAVPPVGGVFEDASAEIADIDSRLHALQNFLKSAKTSAAGL